MQSHCGATPRLLWGLGKGADSLGKGGAIQEGFWGKVALELALQVV